MQGARRSRRTRAQTYRERGKNWDHPHEVRQIKTIQHFYSYPFFWSYSFVSPKRKLLVIPSRYAHRLTPVSNTCGANVPEIKLLAQRVLKPFLALNPATDCLVCPPPICFFANFSSLSLTAEPHGFLAVLTFLTFFLLLFTCGRMQYKIELKVRNHNALSRQTLIDTVVSCVPSGWTVDLEDAKVFILVEVFKVGIPPFCHFPRRDHVHGKKRSKLSELLADQLFRPERLRHWDCKGLLRAPKVQCNGDC